MHSYPDIIVRPYRQLNKDRRALLEVAYKSFPDIVDCSITEQFRWESPEGRTAIFDLYYLESAGYIEIVAQGRKYGIPPTPYAYILTKAGIDLIEKPRELDRLFPIVQVTGNEGTVTLDDLRMLNDIINSLERLREIVQEMPLPENEKRGMLYYITVLLTHPSLQKPVNMPDNG